MQGAQGERRHLARVRRRPEFAFLSAPIDTPIPNVRSLFGNSIGAEGATALAAVLKETKITQLKCAAAPECLLSFQRPMTRLLSHRFHPAPRSQSSE